MVDALVSGASAARRAGSSPVLGTNNSDNSSIELNCKVNTGRKAYSIDNYAYNDRSPL